VDYYEVLQISLKADVQTIHRVFRMMAARFHPDNPETGDVEEFLRLKKAYSVLSDETLRAEYDAMRAAKEAAPNPVFELKDFVTDADAEINRRLGVLSILYNARRMDPEHPGVSMMELEKRMGFPREHLMFALWYLRAKNYVIAGDSSDFELTADGADFVEKKATRSEILGKLLRPGSARTQGPAKRKKPEGDKKKTPYLLGAAEGND
jgi:curved DNA-binding protein CbpA